jgi:hypothetical protein
VRCSRFAALRTIWRFWIKDPEAKGRAFSPEAQKLAASRPRKKKKKKNKKKKKRLGTHCPHPCTFVNIQDPIPPERTTSEAGHIRANTFDNGIGIGIGRNRYRDRVPGWRVHPERPRAIMQAYRKDTNVRHRHPHAR